ncbi:MAG: methionyl-tRNA formyltransferase [Clostridia bacterium]|nr:methionyl-tRNA formyltransferase [Clostridia bacterium]
MKILFMGTPDFAKTNLRKLVESGYDVCGVVSQQDKPRGRKMEMVMPPVKEYALEKNIPVYQPDTLKDGALLPVLQEHQPQLIVVVAYGKLLPEYILNYPKYGCINVHGSLLPKYRGSAPVQWSVINGDKTTGVTTMYMDKGMDTGDILLQKEFDILPKETSGNLMDRMADIGADLLIETIEKLGSIIPVKQENEKATHAPMLSKDMAKMDFSKSAICLQNLVYGMYPWPCAYFETEKGIIKVYEAEAIDADSNKPAGTIIKADKELIIQTGKGQLVVYELQLQGKKRMNIQDFLRGNKMEEGSLI